MGQMIRIAWAIALAVAVGGAMMSIARTSSEQDGSASAYGEALSALERAK